MALALGDPILSPGGLWDVLARGGGDALARVVVLQLRLPRLVLGVMAGASLALVGALLQDTKRNALAGPELLGVTAGAALVLATITVFSLPVAFALYPLLGLAGSLCSGGVVLLAARPTRSPVRLALIGAAVSALLDAVMISVISLGTQEQVQLLYQYLLGSLANRTWDDVMQLLPWTAIGVPLALLCARPLNVLRLGDGVAEGLGLRVERTRVALLLVATLLTAGAVAVVGGVAFAGLVGPHIARWLVGNDARRLFPLSAVVTAGLLVDADILAQTALFLPLPLPPTSNVAPSEWPVGAVTALLGAPFFLLLLRKRT